MQTGKSADPKGAAAVHVAVGVSMCDCNKNVRLSPNCCTCTQGYVDQALLAQRFAIVTPEKQRQRTRKAELQVRVYVASSWVLPQECV